MNEKPKIGTPVVCNKTCGLFRAEETDGFNLLAERGITGVVSGNPTGIEYSVDVVVVKWDSQYFKRSGNSGPERIFSNGFVAPINIDHLDINLSKIREDKLKEIL